MQLAYLHGEDNSSLVDFVENGVECEVLAKWAPHLAPKPTQTEKEKVEHGGEWTAKKHKRQSKTEEK